MSPPIDSVRLDRVELPLSTPYHLSGTTVEHLDTVLVRVRTDETTAVGEVTTLEGYSEVTATEAWDHVRALCRPLPGETTAAAREIVADESVPAFPRAGVAAALASVERSPPSMTVPLVGIVSVSDGVDPVVRSVRDQRRDGFDMFKVKVGFDPVSDAERLTAVAERTGLDSLRVDANQGYTLLEARTFLERVDPSLVACFEQPLPTGNLTAHATLRRESPVPILLDEEVADGESLETIARTEAADMVKLKLMKQGGPEPTRNLIRRARAHDLGLVLGNGVQTGVGCIQEAGIWTETGLASAGEFNGWLKLRTRLVADGLSFADGSLVWEGGVPTVDADVVRSHSVDTAAFGD
jgi:muconate cycloisomerase